MRYDTEVTFVVEKDGYYNPDIGEHAEPTKEETVRYANVTDLGTERSQVLFGDVKQGVKVIRLLRPYQKRWDYVLIREVKYQLVTSRKLRLKNTFILQEVSK